jgi:hypothetical protein
VLPLPEPWGEEVHAERIAVLAVGSNACPGRLLEKFGRGPEEVIPVLQGTWRGGLPVYLSSFAPYGSLPATYWPHRGVESELWVTLLRPGQLLVMNRSEGMNRAGSRYKLARLPGAFRAGGCSLEPVYAYRGGRALDLGTGIVPLSGFILRGRLPSSPPLSQTQVLTRLLDVLGHEPGADLRARLGTARREPELLRRLEKEIHGRFSISDPALDRLPPLPGDVETVRVS